MFIHIDVPSKMRFPVAITTLSSATVTWQKQLDESHRISPMSTGHVKW